MNKKGKNKRGIESKQNDAKFKNWSTTLLTSNKHKVFNLVSSPTSQKIQI